MKEKPQVKQESKLIVDKSDRIKLINLISSIRSSHCDMVYLYTEGQCYNFALILRGQFPGGELWYSHKEGHMYYYIYSRWYDIRGEHFSCPPDCKKYIPIDRDPAHRWGGRDKRRLLNPLN